jgi:hypothetical protein
MSVEAARGAEISARRVIVSLLTVQVTAEGRALRLDSCPVFGLHLAARALVVLTMSSNDATILLKGRVEGTC